VRQAVDLPGVRAAAPSGRDGDRETRWRLLDEARNLFAAHGFKNVTVRQICQAAGANVAAVNYHFGDKLGLYRELLDQAIEIMQQTTLDARSAGEGGSAEQKLRAYIRVFMQRVCDGQGTWIHQLMTREMAEPTPALDSVINDVIVPRIAYVSELVAEMLDVSVDDPLVLRCVLSVQSQFHSAMANPVSRRLVPGLTAGAAAVDTLAEHIADFSIGGIRSLRER
jgi:AcrR family transcriptional regulator